MLNAAQHKVKVTNMKDKDSQLIFEAYSESKDNVEDVVKQIRSTRYALMLFQKYVRELFDNPRDVEQFVQDQRHGVWPGDSEEDFKQKQVDLANRLTVALDYAGGDEDKLNHLFAQLDAAEERWQNSGDFDDDIPGADDGDRYSAGPDIYAAADRDDRAMPPR